MSPSGFFDPTHLLFGGWLGGLGNGGRGGSLSLVILIGGGVADVGGDSSREGFDGQQPLGLGGFGGRGWVGGGPEGPG